MDDALATLLVGERININWDIAPDGGSAPSGAELAEMQKKVCRALGKDNLNFNAFAPIYADRLRREGAVVVGEGLIRKRDDLRQMRFPDLDGLGFWEQAGRFIAHKDDFCAVACIRLGIGATLMSMGLEAFSYAMADDPELIVEVLRRYADWTIHLGPRLAEVGFDIFWAFDDIAFNSGPMFSPEFFREVVLPIQREAARALPLPLITHSDGNMTALVEDWLQIGQQGIHPIQPDVMDIEEVKRRHGHRVCLVGNISMEDLINGTPEEIVAQVRSRIETIGAGGGYIVSSSNSLTANMKPENVRAMSRAIQRYGRYGEA